MADFAPWPGSLRATWYPLLAIKFPDAHHDISGAWAWHRVWRLAKSRKTLLHKERLGYLEGGTQTLIDALEGSLQKAGTELRRNAPVRQILFEDGRAVGLETLDGETHRCDYVVSAVPLPIFLRMTPELPGDYRNQLEAIDFIGVVCIILRLERPLTQNFWTNVNDPRIPFNGCIEYTNLYRDITEDGSAIVYVPHYVSKDHERFGYSDEQLFEECLEAFALINPEFRAEDVIDYTVSRDPYAQIICPSGFADVVPDHQTPVDRLFLIESSQLFPSDRTISGTLDLAGNVARLIRAAEGVPPSR